MLCILILLTLFQEQIIAVNFTMESRYGVTTILGKENIVQLFRTFRAELLKIVTKNLLYCISIKFTF